MFFLRVLDGVLIFTLALIYTSRCRFDKSWLVASYDHPSMYTRYVADGLWMME